MTVTLRNPCACCIRLAILMSLFLAVLGPSSQAVSADESIQHKEFLVGVYYYAGWWPRQPNNYVVNDRDWRTGFPERVPTLGEYNAQRTMDYEIPEAVHFGVDFFQFLTYPETRAPTTAPTTDDPRQLNAGRRLFLASRHRGLLNFAQTYVNREPFILHDVEDWKRTCRDWARAMADRTHLTVDGRPLFIIMDAPQFAETWKDHREDRLRELRAAAQDMQLPAPLIGGGVPGHRLPNDATVIGYDFLTTIAPVPDLPARPTAYPYAQLLDYARQTWARFGDNSPKPYIPCLPAGWDPRPMAKNERFFERPTRQAWRDALHHMREAFINHDRLGLPTAVGRQKILLIYAWNRFGQGSYLAPTRGESDNRMLEELQRAFGTRMQISETLRRRR